MKKKEKIKPKYITWYEDAFQAELRVRHMRPIQRHFYRSLLIQANYCSTRPYLPDDDSQLWMLADADSLEHWTEHAHAVRAMFTPVTIGGTKLLSQKRLLKEWETMEVVFSGKGYGNKKMQAGPGGSPVAGASSRRGTPGDTGAEQTLADRNRPEPDPSFPDPTSTQRSGAQRSEAKLTDRQTEQSPTTAASASGSGSSGSHPQKQDGRVQTQVAAGLDGKANGAFTGADSGRAVGSGKPVTTKMQTFDDVEDKVWQGVTTETLVNNYWAVARRKPDAGKWCGAKSESDVDYMRGIVQMHGTDKVKMVIEHLGRTDYWGCHQKGKVDGIKGLGRALEAICAQAQNYVQKVKKTKLGVQEL